MVVTVAHGIWGTRAWLTTGAGPEQWAGMILQIPFPDLSPEIFTIELGDFAFALRWYALAYIVGIVIGWRIVRALMQRPTLWPGDAAPVSEQVLAPGVRPAPISRWKAP